MNLIKFLIIFKEKNCIYNNNNKYKNNCLLIKYTFDLMNHMHCINLAVALLNISDKNNGKACIFLKLNHHKIHHYINNEKMYLKFFFIYLIIYKILIYNYYYCKII